MAVVHTRGDPNAVGPTAIQAIYGSVYTYKFAQKKQGHDFKVEALRARWTGAGLDGNGQLSGEREQWEGAWGLPVPDGTSAVPQKTPEVQVGIEVWDYGTVAEILHEGPYSAEPPTVQRLHEFIAANGYQIAGPHEEEYLTRPDAKVPRTIIRYRIKKAG
jgi:hypothetical protein